MTKARRYPKHCDRCGVNLNRYNRAFGLCRKCNLIVSKEVIMIRPDWDLYFIRIAKEVASRSTCNRAAVGVVIVRDNRIIATGYNGSPPGKPHCIDEGCIMKDGHCIRTVHAEANAIRQANQYVIRLKGAKLYCWDSKGRYYGNLEELKKQCKPCYIIVKASGITRVSSRGL